MAPLQPIFICLETNLSNFWFSSKKPEVQVFEVSESQNPLWNSVILSRMRGQQLLQDNFRSKPEMKVQTENSISFIEKPNEKIRYRQCFRSLADKIMTSSKFYATEGKNTMFLKIRHFKFPRQNFNIFGTLKIRGRRSYYNRGSTRGAFNPEASNWRSRSTY